MRSITTGDRTKEIKKELAELNQTLKMTVRKAIRVGQLLAEQKEYLGHGNWLPWLERNLDISDETARKYMKLYEYQDKTQLSWNLQEAYRQIETLEEQERQSEQEKKRTLLAEYRRTGVKPDGWDQSLDRVIEKDAENIKKQQERIEEAAQEREERAKEYKLNRDKSYISDEALRIATDNFLEKSKKIATWKEKIRLSDGGREDAFLDALIEYFETLPDDNRRIEACNNIIKICRNIAIQLQGSVAYSNREFSAPLKQ